MYDRARELQTEAESLRSADDLTEAGYTYTLAAHEYAGAATRVFPEPGSQELALRELLKAATCYRIGGDEFRTQNRCDLGILLAEDHFEYINEVGYEEGTFAALRRGAWPEFIGDFRTIAERGDADEAYEQAISIYESAGDFEFVCAEQEHMALTVFVESIRRGLGQDVPEEAPERRGFGYSFSEWVKYKREQLPELLAQLEEQGEWPVG